MPFPVRSFAAVLSALALMPATGVMAAAQYDDLSQALAAAAREGRPVFAEVGTDHCPACRDLEANALKDPAITQRLRSFVTVHIDGDARPDLVSKYAITGYPTVLALDPRGGAVIARSVGSVPAETLAAKLDQAMARVGSAAPAKASAKAQTGQTRTPGSASPAQPPRGATATAGGADDARGLAISKGSSRKSVPPDAVVVASAQPAAPVTASGRAPAAQTGAGTASQADVSRWMKQAEANLTAGRKREARAMYAKVYENDSRNRYGSSDRAYIQVAALTVDSNDDALRNQAYTRIREFPARFPNSACEDHYTVIRAILAKDLGDTDEAHSLLDRFPQRYPRSRFIEFARKTWEGLPPVKRPGAKSSLNVASKPSERGPAGANGTSSKPAEAKPKSNAGGGKKDVAKSKTSGSAAPAKAGSGSTKASVSLVDTGARKSATPSKSVAAAKPARAPAPAGDDFDPPAGGY